MFELKSFPSSFTSVHSQKRKEKKILLKLRNAAYFPRQTCNFYLDNFTFFPSLPSLFPCATEWQSTFLKVGLELFGERLVVESSTGRERKNARLLCWIAIAKTGGGSLDRKTRKFSFEPPFIFSPRAPHLFTFRSPPGSSTRRKEKIEHPLNFLFPWGHSRRPLGRAFLIIFDSLEMSAGQRDVSKRPFNSSPIDRDSIISDRIHIWRYNLVSISEFHVKMSPRPSRKILLY